jgi:predicted transglutaminase-like cysteine proteinase
MLAFVLTAASADAASQTSSSQQQTIRPLPQASYAELSGVTTPPAGWVDFCARYQGECDGGPLEARDIHLTLSTWNEIVSVNRFVNQSIEPLSDLEHWGVVDQWDLPYDGKGDCEDYVLFKRKILIDQGFPRQALLVTVVKDENGDGHAVLTAKTDHGEFLLDNMVGDVRPWQDTPYVFVKRQSQTDQNMWQQIGPPTDMPAIVSR